jgi:hypothetical protein
MIVNSILLKLFLALLGQRSRKNSSSLDKLLDSKRFGRQSMHLHGEKEIRALEVLQLNFSLPAIWDESMMSFFFNPSQLANFHGYHFPKGEIRQALPAKRFTYTLL